MLLGKLTERSELKLVIGFVLISGMGWLSDILVYFVATHLFLASSFSANFLSSFIGVTLVWFLSMKSLFNVTSSSRRYFLFLYWAWQAISIFWYSRIIQELEGYLSRYYMSGFLFSYYSMIAKIVITPINLLTNFLFIRWLGSLIKTVIRDA